MFFFIGFIVAVVNVFAGGTMLEKTLGIMMTLPINLYVAPAMFSRYEMSERGIASITHVILFSKELFYHKEFIRWEDVTYVDGAFSVFPPYVITINGFDTESSKKTVFSVERFSPNINELYRLIYNHVDSEAISDEFEKGARPDAEVQT